jgi:hypothetical protein
MNTSTFKSKWNSRFADNIIREIEESDLREFVEDIADNFYNADDFTAPSASFSSITGNATDNSSINTLAGNIINTVRGGIGVDYNTLKKLYDYFTSVTGALQEEITAISGGDSTT